MLRHRRHPAELKIRLAYLNGEESLKAIAKARGEQR